MKSLLRGGLALALGFQLVRCAVRATRGRPLAAIRQCVARRAASAGSEPPVAAAGSAVVDVYSTVGCPYCVRAKKKLAQLGVPYVEHDVMGDEAMRQRVAQLASRTSVPQIFIGGVHLGGCDDLMAAATDGRLEQLLAASGISRIAPEAPAGASEAGIWDIAELLPKGGILNNGSGHPSSASLLSDTAPRTLGARAGAPPAAAAGQPAQLASELQRTILSLYDDFVLADGSRVDYAKMVRSGRLHAYAALASRLGELSPAELPADVPARLAFWINLYNALVIHANAVLGAPAGKAGRAALYSGASGVAYRVAGFRLSLDDIEHGIVRGSPPGDARSFAPDDPRAPLAVPRAAFDARVHFALNCGARSCPPIKIFDAANLERGLALAARSFCESAVLVDEARRTVTLSRLFDWYRVDFGRNDAEVLGRVATFLEGAEAGAALGRILSGTDGTAGGITVEYSEYDWGDNSAGSSGGGDS